MKRKTERKFFALRSDHTLRLNKGVMQNTVVSGLHFEKTIFQGILTQHEPLQYEWRTMRYQLVERVFYAIFTHQFFKIGLEVTCENLKVFCQVF